MAFDEVGIIKWLGGILVAVFAWIFKDLYGRVGALEKTDNSHDQQFARLTTAIENQNVILTKMDMKMDKQVEKHDDSIEGLRKAINQLQITVATLPRRATDKDAN